MIRIVEEEFDPWAALAEFGRTRSSGAGAIASFVGLVRDFDGDRAVTSLTLEHYPGMAETELARIEAEAMTRWPIEAILIMHRVGRMLPAEPIVLVAVASAHRAAALEACHFLIDWLKSKAPIWKLEEGTEGARWIEAKSADDAAAARWR